jgi:hypothetical protein
LSPVVSFEELEVLRQMPVYIDANGMMPFDAPDPAILHRLEAKGLVVMLPNGGGRRWALTPAGIAIVTPDLKDR